MSIYDIVVGDVLPLKIGDQVINDFTESVIFQDHASLSESLWCILHRFLLMEY